MNIALVTGGFDPVHPGHINMFREAKWLGDVVVGLNSDAWLTRKKGVPFMSWPMRAQILESIRYVSHVIPFNDDDDTAIDAITETRNMFPDAKIFFCNGGDRTEENIPETSSKTDNVEFVFGIGGTVKQASSSALQEVVKRPWGFYHVLARGNDWLVKRIIVRDGHMTSLQRHKHRGEWMTRMPHGPSWYIPPWSEHRLGPGEYIEIQSGSMIDENDIIRIADEYGR